MFEKKILLPHQYYYPALELMKDRVTNESREEFLKSIPHGNKRVLLYVHFPFCDSHCAFCGFDKRYNLDEIKQYICPNVDAELSRLPGVEARLSSMSVVI